MWCLLDLIEAYNHAHHCNTLYKSYRGRQKQLLANKATHFHILVTIIIDVTFIQ